MASEIYKTAFNRELEYFVSVFSEDSWVESMQQLCTPNTNVRVI